MTRRRGVADSSDSWNDPSESAELPPATVDASPHAPLDGPRFAEHDTLGMGGGGRVVRAVDRRLDRDVALKIVAADKPLAQRRLRREATILVALEHPGIVPLYDLVERADGGLQLALRIVRGRSLQHVLAGTSGDRASLLTHLRHLARAAEAVAWAHHKGFVHRDLKPANIMIGEFGETQVIDWGLAAHLGRPAPDDADDAGDADANRASDAATAGLTHAGAVLGTPRYMSPEQARGEVIDRRADVWALGCILFEIIAQRPAFAESDIAAVLADVRNADTVAVQAQLAGAAVDLAAIVTKAMDADVERRYPDARAFAADLNAWLDGRPVAAFRYAPWRKLTRFVSKRRLPLALGTALAGALVALAMAPAPRVVQDTRLADALQAGIAERNVALGHALALESETLFAKGLGPEAARTATRSLALAPSPIARGVLALTAGRDGPRLVAEAALDAHCVTITPHPNGLDWLCRRADALVMYHGLEVRWRHPEPSDGAAFVAHGDQVVAIDARQRLTRLDALTGATRSRSDPIACRGQLVTGVDAEHALLQGRLCLVRIDRERVHWALRGVALQAAALGRQARWAALGFDGGLALGDDDAIDPEARALTPTDLGDALIDVSAMALDGDAIVLGTLRGELIRMGLDGHVEARRTLLADIPLTTIAPSPSGRVLAVGADRGGPLLVLPQALQVLTRLPESDASASLWLSDTTLVTIGARRATWDLTATRITALEGFTGLMAVAVDGPLLAIATERGVTLLDRARGEIKARRASPRHVKSVALDGDEIVLSRLEGTAIERFGHGFTPHPSPAGSMVRRLAFVASGALVALPYRRELWLVPPASPGTREVVDGDEYIDVAAQGDHLALVSRAGDVVLMTLRDAPIERARCLAPGAIAATLSPDAERLYVAFTDAVMQLDARDCAVVGWSDADHEGRTLHLSDVQASADGAWFAAAAREGHVLIWASDGTRVASVRAHAQRVAQLVFDARGDLLSAGWDGVVRVHDLTTLSLDPSQLTQRITSLWGRLAP